MSGCLHNFDKASTQPCRQAKKRLLLVCDAFLQKPTQLNIEVYNQNFSVSGQKGNVCIQTTDSFPHVPPEYHYLLWLLRQETGCCPHKPPLHGSTADPCPDFITSMVFRLCKAESCGVFSTADTCKHLFQKNCRGDYFLESPF